MPNYHNHGFSYSKAYIIISSFKQIFQFDYVRLNLFNHVLALLRTKFAYNSIIRYHAFRWELCKSCERVWRNSRMCAFRGFSRQDLVSDSQLATRQNATRVKHAENWRVMIVGALQDKKYSLAWQLSRDLNSRLMPLARLSR